MKQNDIEFSVSPDVIAAGHYWARLKDDPHKWRIAEVTYTDVHIRNNMSIEVTGRGSIGDVEEHEIAEWGPCVTPPPCLEEPARPPISPDEMAAHREALERFEDEIASKVAAALADSQVVSFVEVTGKVSF